MHLRILNICVSEAVRPYGAVDQRQSQTERHAESAFYPAPGPLPDVFTLQHPIITSLIWAVVLMAIFAPLSVRRFQRMGR